MVVPCEPGGDPGPCLRALKALPGAEKALITEVFVAWGLHPSHQRNVAVAASRAPWVLFLDADSRVQAGQLPGLLAAALDLGADVAGGPNLAPDDEGPWARHFDAVQGSWAGSGTSRARYRAVGRRRLAGEKELILCNLLVRRRVFEQSGGFREDLYPNEENELFNRLQAKGVRLAYEPAAAVRRPRRQRPADFVKQAFRYGRGRAQQMRSNFFPSDLVNLAPLLLTAALAAALGASWRWRTALLLPEAYLLAAWLSQSASATRALFLVLRHLAYAAGLLAGMVQDTPRRDPAVRLQRVALGAGR